MTHLVEMMMGCGKHTGLTRHGPPAWEGPVLENTTVVYLEVACNTAGGKTFSSRTPPESRSLGIFAMRANQVTVAASPEVTGDLPVTQVTIGMLGTPTGVVMSEGVGASISPQLGEAGSI